jgi:[ribosomal protein S5]-alanine N-acetyltransferase
VIVETGRLILRPYRLADAEAIHRYGSDPEVSRYTEYGPNTWDDTLRFLQAAVRPIPPKIQLGVTLRGDDAVAGGVGAWPVAEGRWEMGWGLRRDLWGNGYATEATRAIADVVAARGDVHTIVARCRPENVASARVMEKLGMHLVEVLPHDKQVGGEWRDTAVYEVTLSGADVRA